MNQKVVIYLGHNKLVYLFFLIIFEQCIIIIDDIMISPSF
jgi:hypothetical protein